MFAVAEPAMILAGGPAALRAADTEQDFSMVARSAIGWLIFGAALAAANCAAISLKVMSHPTACLVLMVIIVLMQRVIWFGAMWFCRCKAAERNEVMRLLEEIETTND